MASAGLELFLCLLEVPVLEGALIETVSELPVSISSMEMAGGGAGPTGGSPSSFSSSSWWPPAGGGTEWVELIATSAADMRRYKLS